MTFQEPGHCDASRGRNESCAHPGARGGLSAPGSPYTKGDGGRGC